MRIANEDIRQRTIYHKDDISVEDHCTFRPFLFILIKTLYTTDNRCFYTNFKIRFKAELWHSISYSAGSFIPFCGMTLYTSELTGHNIRWWMKWLQFGAVHHSRLSNVHDCATSYYPATHTQSSLPSKISGYQITTSIQSSKKFIKRCMEVIR